MTPATVPPIPRPAGPGPWWRQAGAALLEAVFPRTCLSCGVFLGPRGAAAFRAGREALAGFPPPAPDGAAYRAALDGFLCAACAADFEGLAAPFCVRCGGMFPSRAGANRTCGGCLAQSSPLGMARSLGRYAGSLRRAVQQLKYRGRRELADPLGGLLLEAFRHHWAREEVDLVLPVPLHPRRERRRGFNQSALVVRSWARDLSRRGASGPAVAADGKVLARPKATPPQTGLGAADRRRNLRGAFRVAQPRAVAGRHVLLVDDVYTTGATAQACARVLAAAGARRVDLLTLARADG